ncbi:metallophosphoesterase [Candidatus Woesearchaeota archaeon]|nr:metallophosphoesterase [Candidatus Woesearchaeota archaeon]
MVKLTVCSDIHGDLESLVHFANFTKSRGSDKIIIAGDLITKPYTKEHLDALQNGSLDKESFLENKRIHARNTYTQMKQILDTTNIPYSVIPGNYDTPEDIHAVFQNNDLHNNTTLLGDQKFAGFGGADAYPPHIHLLVGLNEINYNDDTMITLFNAEQPDIIVTHNPPHGLCDDMFNGANVGSPSLRQYIREHQPKLVICGHIHEAGPLGNNPNGVKGIAKEGDTYVVNPGNLGIFQLLNPQTLKPVQSFDNGTFAEIEYDNEVKNVRFYRL